MRPAFVPFIALAVTGLALAQEPVEVPPLLPPESNAIDESPYSISASLTPASPENIRVHNTGDLSFDQATGVLTYTGDVAVRTDTYVQLFADRAVIDTKAESITLTGNVSIYQGGILHRGERAVYFYETQQFDLSGLRSSIDPILLEAGEFRLEERNGRQVLVGEDAGVTTDDSEHPDYWLRADRTTVYPDNRVVFNNLKLYAGGTPVFWLPYLSQPLDADLGYHFIPGARSNWGAYLLNTYGIMLGGERDPVTGENADAWLLSQWRLDFRSRRGVAGGLDLFDTRLEDKTHYGWLKLYYLNDLAPSTTRSSIPRGAVNEDRWSVALQNIFPLEMPSDPAGEWEIRADLTAMSDRYFLEDFDPSIFRINPNPDNTIALNRRSGRSLASLFARLRVNDFYRTDTRLPELSFDQVRGPLFGSPILHQGSTFAGIYREELADFRVDSLRSQIAALPPGDPRIPGLLALLEEPAFQRFHSYQEFSLPVNLGGWLALNPHAGIGHTAYRAVSGPISTESRTLVHGGIDASVKFSRAYPDIQIPRWGVDGLLHVVQPYVGWSVVSTNELDSTFPSIDRVTFTTRPRSIRVGSFSAIDDLRSWNIIRPGVRHKFITRRDGGSHEWLTLDTYIEAFVRDPELRRDFSNLYNDVRWHPLPWLRLELETQFPFLGSGSGFTEVATRGTIMPHENLEISLGYRFLDNHPVLVDSSRIDLKAYLRLNDHWGIGMNQLWQMDDGVVELQQYTIHRDLGSWVASLGLSQRDHRGHEERGLLLSVTLKDFPSASLPLRLDAE